MSPLCDTAPQGVHSSRASAQRSSAGGFPGLLPRTWTVACTPVPPVPGMTPGPLRPLVRGLHLWSDAKAGPRSPQSPATSRSRPGRLTHPLGRCQAWWTRLDTKSTLFGRFAWPTRRHTWPAAGTPGPCRVLPTEADQTQARPIPSPSRTEAALGGAALLFEGFPLAFPGGREREGKVCPLSSLARGEAAARARAGSCPQTRRRSFGSPPWM